MSEEDIGHAFKLLMRERGIVANADISVGHRTRDGITTYFGAFEYVEADRVGATQKEEERR